MDFNYDDDVSRHLIQFKYFIKASVEELFLYLWNLIRYLFHKHPNICWSVLLTQVCLFWLLLFAQERVRRNTSEKKVFKLEQKIDSIQQKSTSYVKPSKDELNYIETHND